MPRIKYWMPSTLRELLEWLMIIDCIIGFIWTLERAGQMWGISRIESIWNIIFAIIFWNLHFVWFGYLMNNKKENKNG